MTAVEERLDAWTGFRGVDWRHDIDVRGFIQDNYTPYEGEDAFLAGPTERTTGLWWDLSGLFAEERRRGILDVDVHTPSTITSHRPGYLDRAQEFIVGLQTDAPLKRAIMPNGGLRMVEASLEAYGYELDPAVKEVFTKYRKTHNDGVFDAYTDEIKRAIRAAAWRSRVDLPIPGSPPISVADPSTKPPPSARSNSAMPVGMRSGSDTSASSALSWIERPPVCR